MTDNAPSSPDFEQIRAQRRRTRRADARRSIGWPFALALLVVLALIVIPALLPTQQQASLMADWLTIWLVLCPVFLCFFPLYLLVALGIYGMQRLHQGTEAPLERLERFMVTTLTRVDRSTEAWHQRLIRWDERFAPLRRVLSAFDEPVSTSHDDESDERQNGRDQANDANSNPSKP